MGLIKFTINSVVWQIYSLKEFSCKKNLHIVLKKNYVYIYFVNKTSYCYLKHSINKKKIKYTKL